ncbi:MAG: methyltransferase [Gemmatimonadales bacterium]|nr:methyltransferase [Gemmatimonadales bacterium]
MADTLRDRLLAWRDRWLADLRFQEWSMGQWWARPVARRRARRVFDLAAGFTYTQTLLAALRLGLFDLLAPGPLTAAQLAARTGLPTEAMERLLRACCALDLCDRRSGDRVGLGVLGAACVGRPALLAVAEHNVAMYRDLDDPLALLRGEPPAGREVAGLWRYVRRPPGAPLGAEDVAGYSAFAAATASLVLADVASAYPIAGHRRLLDVGGGEGQFLRAVASHAPALELMLFDLPPVVERARARFAEAGLASRASLFGGDFRADPLPRGADLVSLVRILHDHDDDDVARLLRAVHAALPPGGRLLVAEPMADADRAEPVTDVYFMFFFLTFGQGRARRAGEIAALLRDAGFVRPRPLQARAPAHSTLLLAERR